jgi:hypothetical protein
MGRRKKGESPSPGSGRVGGLAHAHGEAASPEPTRVGAPRLRRSRAPALVRHHLAPPELREEGVETSHCLSRWPGARAAAGLQRQSLPALGLRASAVRGRRRGVPGWAEAVAEGESERMERRSCGAGTHGCVGIWPSSPPAVPPHRERGRKGRGWGRQRAAGGAPSGLGERRQTEAAAADACERVRVRYILGVEETGGPLISKSNAPNYFCYRGRPVRASAPNALLSLNVIFSLEFLVSCSVFSPLLIETVFL